MEVPTLLLAALVLLLIYVANLLQKHFCYWRNLNIACDPPHWLMGNLSGLMTTKSFVQIIQEYYDKYRNCGPFAGFYCFAKPAVFVMDPELIKLILIKDFSKFADRGFYCNEEDDPLTGQLFTQDSVKWRHMRNKLSPTFTAGKMKIMFPLVIKLVHDLTDTLEVTLANNPVVEVRDLAARYTTDVIASCAFGLDTNSLKNPNVEFRKMSRKALVERRYGILGFVIRLSFPALARRLHITETMPDVEEFFLGIVKETIDYREQHKIRRNDFMDMLIDLKNNNNKLAKSETGAELTNLTLEEIAAQAFVFLLAGYESSSTTMSFVLYELAQNQMVQQRAREEVERVLAAHTEFSYECIKELVYLEQIMQETLRLYTILPALNRVALEDYEVPEHPEYVIKRGMRIFIPAAAIHRDERYFPQPNIFNPDNFSAENMAARDSILNLSFGDGPRNCIGMRFGKMQTLVGLALLLKNFKFSVCDQTAIPMKFDKKTFLVSAEGGIYLKVEKLQR